MDSDDISRPERCALQLLVFKNNPQVAICSGTIEEFITTPDDARQQRVLPEDDKSIKEFAKRRNPFNHVAVMYKKSAVLDAGNYQSFHYLEDYYLWIRMFQKGYQGYNISQPLVWVRTGFGMIRRRGGFKYIRSQVKLFKYMLDVHYINYFEYITNVLIRFLSGIMPNKIRGYFFKNHLRENKE